MWTSSTSRPVRNNPRHSRNKRPSWNPMGSRKHVRINGWEAGIRTPIRRSRVCSPTVRRPPRVAASSTDPRSNYSSRKPLVTLADAGCRTQSSGVRHRELWSGDLEESEGHFDGHAYGDGRAVFLAGMALPSLYGFNGLIIQAQAQRFEDFRVRNGAVGLHNRQQHDHALVFRFARLFGVRGLRLVVAGRRGNTPADAISAAAVRPAITGPEATAVAWADPLAISW